MEEMIHGLEIRMEHAEKDICDLKNNDKDLYKEISVISLSHAEIKFYSKQIQESQVEATKKAEINQELMMKTMQEIKEKPFKDYDRIKIAVYIFAATYIAGNVFGMVKILTP